MKRRVNRKKKVYYDEYISPDERDAKTASFGDIHTEYHGRTHHTIRMPLPQGIQPMLPTPPPLGSVESPTPRLDWVLSEESPYRIFDGDLELEEMAECELEALGLKNYLKPNLKTGDKVQADPEEEVPQKKRKTQSTHPIHFWTPHIDTYVEEFLRLEGIGGQANLQKCSEIGCISDLEAGAFRCKDCWSGSLLCLACVLRSHSVNPFHRIEASGVGYDDTELLTNLQVWTGHYFRRTSLKKLGMRVQLGHDDCPIPMVAFNDEFVVIARTGIHEIALDYCGCPSAPSKPIQLLRARLFPSTVGDPKTAATFDVLEHFQLLSFNSKVSGYEYYSTLSRLTDNTGTKAPPDRYPVFLRIIREWRHVRLLKRMGRGHSETGVNGTKEGECAVLCPACPHPGINLPDNWKERPESEQWLYSLFIAIDANFRLKRMNVSTDERDPGLNHGYAYMVESCKFKNYLANYDGQVADEKSSCNNHDAIKSANSRGGHGTAASGLGTAECSRHDMKRPVAVGDLQKGERYVNMDYFFLSTIAATLLLRLVVSYDIACQWWINLMKRCQLYPKNVLSDPSNLSIVYLVPKFHLAAHIQKCQTSFSFNYTPGVGRTDGEAPERGWATANGIASSTKEMGPGSRNDTLDDHFGDYNWRKIITIVVTFLRKAKEAIQERQEQVEAFIEFDAALPEESTSEWTQMCLTWEKDSSQPNPYVIPKNSSVKESDVRLQLAREDSDALKRGEMTTLHEEVTPSVLISQGLQLEESQARLALDISKLGAHSTNIQQTKILERSNSLKRRIDAWINIQHLYMPAVAALRARENLQAETPVAVQDIKLYLPSYNTETIRFSSHILLKCESQYRYAQAEDCLNNLRAFLLLRSHMLNSKKRHSRGQRMQTRSLTLLAAVEEKIKFATARYNVAYQALDLLSTPTVYYTWRDILRPLLDTDVRGLSSMDDSGSEGRKKLSWIWKVHGMGEDAEKCTQAALRIEWCKARARAHRWQEECVLLAEEMRRVIAFFAWQAAQWDSRAQDIIDSTDVPNRDAQAINSGKIAYAKKQADIRRDIGDRCAKQWDGVTEKLTTMSEGRNAYKMVECH
ncbi:hypothetical protein JR316_0004538 [Psilocybe cubensis]|uniref:CxC2-like cysteine cluster KDZ transposase-associated domain-containing protein n=2 Tax=Psilocybe cubensis TaxID=181762 RepID=A0A8H7XXS4_PSICU|nr:hypothetical protein JR316_0004538 [Psilocybe cubensis]KAH9482438.1 hypothetical protein JR316_0004538 [Psilocybe cubensis]